MHSILFSDNDSLAQNTGIVYEIRNDSMELLIPKCQAFEVDHVGLTSAINCSKQFIILNNI